MSFISVWNNIRLMVGSFLIVTDYTYHMIVDNILLLCFVLIFAIFVGLALLKRLIHIN